MTSVVSTAVSVLPSIALEVNVISRSCACSKLPSLARGRSALSRCCFAATRWTISASAGLLAAILLAPPGHVRVGREPDVALALRVLDQRLDDRQPRPVTGDVRVQGQQEQPALLPRAVELAGEDLEHRAGRRVRPQGAEADEVVIDGVVADPLRRQLDHPGRL